MKLGIRSTHAGQALLLTGLLALAGVALRAQNDAPPPGPNGHRGPNPERQVEMLTHVLSLTPEQQTQVRGLLTEQGQKMEELRKSSAGADAASQGAPPSREQMEAIRNDTDTKINALLTEEQKPKFAAWQQERKQRMEHREGAPPPPNA
jgi:Spy/CpxP family protein refolding chaperone